MLSSISRLLCPCTSSEQLRKKLEFALQRLLVTYNMHMMSALTPLKGYKYSVQLHILLILYFSYKDGDLRLPLDFLGRSALCSIDRISEIRKLNPGLQFVKPARHQSISRMCSGSNPCSVYYIFRKINLIFCKIFFSPMHCIGGNIAICYLPLILSDFSALSHWGV